MALVKTTSTTVTQPPPIQTLIKGDALHGQTTTFTDPKLRVIFFAAVFLPGKIKKAKDGQKEMIVVHEFIHSAGIERQRLARFAGISAFSTSRAA
jgi:hypothetical protein